MAREGTNSPPRIRTGVNVKDLGDPVWQRAFQQTDRLSEVVEYAISGAEKLVPLPRAKPGAHLDSSIRMRQRQPLDGPYEARCLYVAGCSPARELGVTPIVRRTVWRKDRDWKRSRSRNVVSPDLEEEYFRIDELQPIQAALSDVKSALESWKLDILGVAGWDDEPGTSPERSYQTVQAPYYVRSLSLPANPASITLEYITVWTDERLNDAWEKLWNAFGAALEDKRRITRIKVSYRVPLKRYAQALASMKSK